MCNVGRVFLLLSLAAPQPPHSVVVTHTKQPMVNTRVCATACGCSGCTVLWRCAAFPVCSLQCSQSRVTTACLLTGMGLTTGMVCACTHVSCTCGVCMYAVVSSWFCWLHAWLCRWCVWVSVHVCACVLPFRSVLFCVAWCGVYSSIVLVNHNQMYYYFCELKYFQ